MYLTTTKRTYKGKTYECPLLRESYREGDKVKSRTIASLKGCTPEEIAAIAFALKHKHDLEKVCALEDVNLREGRSIGAVWIVYQIAKRLGIETALGTDRQGKLALWQVIARVIDQGSRLSAVRLADVHALSDILGIRKGFTEHALYGNLSWLSENQQDIEQRLFKNRHPNTPPTLFLYDVTSSYLEGTQNEYAAYGYNRDGKRGKQQIVVGMLCDPVGAPVSPQVFAGNTQDTQTFSDQIQKAADEFGCTHVTFVGDRGMIKRMQITELLAHGFHYISAISKPQIRTLIKHGALQLRLFEDELMEVEDDGVRYVLRRNPTRADAMKQTRTEKHACLQAYVDRKNLYLNTHSRADTAVAMRDIREHIQKLHVEKWLSVSAEERTLSLCVDEDALSRIAVLDGCYVLRTDLPATVADTETVHARYRDLTKVERAFRTCKTTHLELRPVHVRKEESTRGHVLVVMLAYMIVRELDHLWRDMDVTVEEGLEHLKTLCSMGIEIGGECKAQRIPAPRDTSAALLTAADVILPTVLPHLGARVVTTKSRTKSS